MKPIIQFSLLILIFLSITFTASIQKFNRNEYCQLEEEKCDGEPHIGCFAYKHNEQNVSECKFQLTFEATDEFQVKLLDFFNGIRNDLAEGEKYQGWPKATRMRTMKWDPELQKIAYAQVKVCLYNREMCMVTRKYDNVGHISAVVEVPDRAVSEAEIEQIVEEKVFPMLLEQNDKWTLKPAEQILSYQFENETKEFYMIARENNEAVACTLSTFTNIDQEQEDDPEMKKSYVWLECVFPEKNLLEKPVYNLQGHCSKCYTPETEKFTNLCKDDVWWTQPEYYEDDEEGPEEKENEENEEEENEKVEEPEEQEPENEESEDEEKPEEEEENLRRKMIPKASVRTTKKQSKTTKPARKDKGRKY